MHGFPSCLLLAEITRLLHGPFILQGLFQFCINYQDSWFQLPCFTTECLKNEDLSFSLWFSVCVCVCSKTYKQDSNLFIKNTDCSLYIFRDRGIVFLPELMNLWAVWRQDACWNFFIWPAEELVSFHRIIITASFYTIILKRQTLGERNLRTWAADMITNKIDILNSNVKLLWSPEEKEI